MDIISLNHVTCIGPVTRARVHARALELAVIAGRRLAGGNLMKPAHEPAGVDLAGDSFLRHFRREDTAPADMKPV